MLDNILRLKRSFGVHVILCTQSVRGLSEVNEAAMAQIAVRIALKCPREDAEILLGAGSDAIAQIEDNDAGSAIYLPAISTPKTNNRFRVGYISQEAHNGILKAVEAHYARNGSKRWNTRVLVSDVADSRDSVFQEYLKRNKLIVEPRKIHFGESLNIDRSLAVPFETRKNENLLLAGKDAQKAQNLLFFISPKLGERCRTDKSIYYTLDFNVTPHLLRHTYITNLIHEGVDPKTVQYLAGHENSKVTMDIYAKVKYNKPWELAAVVNEAFQPSTEYRENPAS